MSLDLMNFPFDPWLFLPISAVMWISVMAFFARFGGWTRLASKFASAAPVSGQAFRFVSGSVGHGLRTVRYRGSLFVRVGVDGLGLSLLFPFRIFSPSLFIPWSEIDAAVKERVFLVDSIRFQIRDEPVRVCLRGTAAEKARAMFERSRLRAAPPPDAQRPPLAGLTQTMVARGD